MKSFFFYLQVLKNRVTGGGRFCSRQCTSEIHFITREAADVIFRAAKNKTLIQNAVSALRNCTNLYSDLIQNALSPSTGENACS
jgi:hypothetical protein